MTSHLPHSELEPEEADEVSGTDVRLFVLVDGSNWNIFDADTGDPQDVSHDFRVDTVGLIERVEWYLLQDTAVGCGVSTVNVSKPRGAEEPGSNF